MTRKEIDIRYHTLCEKIYHQKIKAALDDFDRFIRLSSNTDYFYQLETISDNYRTLLRYSFEGYKDPQQNTILSSLCASLLGMADEIRQSLLDKEFPQKSQEKQTLLHEFGDDPQVIATTIEEIFFSREIGKLIEETELAGISSDPALPARIMDPIFKLIWLTDKIKEQHLILSRKINRSENIEWHEKCLIVSAITLSLINYFDPQKFILLIEFAESRQNQVYQRALTGIILGLLVYDQRITFYPDLVEKMNQLCRDEIFRNDVELILLQLLMARETEKITREFEEEVLPDMKKMMPKIEDKLQLGDLGEEDDPEGENPKWKGLVDEVPGLFEKIEKFSRMQMEGADVFMSTFQLLKRFDFFNSMCNWFIPFHRNHPDIRTNNNDPEEIGNRLIDSLEKAFYICNSDKYSFALNFQAIPNQQRTMIVTNFEAEFAQMKEMASEEQLLDQSLASNSIYIQYIQDLYRFFKLFPSRQEFDDIFQRRIHFNELYFYRTFFEREGFTQRLALFYFEKDHYPEAIEVYEYLLNQSSPRGEYFEKIGYAYQKMRRYKKAAEFYKKAELFDSDRLWILKKLGWCSMKLDAYSEALSYYQDAARMQPDDLQLQSQIAQCHLNLKDYELALQTYAKLRFFKPDDMKVLRPVAYCLFLLGKLDQAEEIYKQIISGVAIPTAYDLMNAAHVQLCQGHRDTAQSLYRQSLAYKTPGIDALMSAFDEDTPFIIANGIPEEEIPLIKDYLQFKSEP